MKQDLFKMSGLMTIFIMLTSCQSPDIVLPDQVDEHSSKVSNEYEVNGMMDIDDALESAAKKFEALFGRTTRTSDKSLESVEIFVKNGSENSKEGGANYYIINYNDGYAIVGADRWNNKVYALSETGAVHISDTIDNQGLRWYMENMLPDGSRLSDTQSVIGVDTTSRKPTNKFITTRIANPMMIGNIKKLHQEYPYSKFLSRTDYKVGCTAVAAGMVMGYFEWPEVYKGYSFDWESMIYNNNIDHWARLFQLLGEKQNLDMDYGVEGSGSTYTLYPRTFANMGYEGTRYSSFSPVGVEIFLKGFYPVIIAGTRKNEEGKIVGHTWIIDGGYKEHWSNPPSEEYEKDTMYYFHCLWGWEGNMDGYFLYENATLGGHYTELDNGVAIGQRTYSDLKMISGFEPVFD